MSGGFPDFIGVGASRSGTTALYDLLDRHPQVYMAKPKEIHYFTFRHPELGAPDPLTPAQYANHFSDAGSARVSGEISPSYLWVPGTAQRIHRLLGPIRILILLRNPIERTFSDFSYSHRIGRNQVSFSEFLRLGQPLLDRSQLTLDPFHPTAILWKGFYAQQVKSYLDVFGRDRIFIRSFEEMTGDVPRFRGALTGFLGIEDKWPLQLNRVNESQNQTPMNYQEKEMLRAVFREDIRSLEALLDRDLGVWLT
jgi:hypothetical protein